MAMFTLMRKNQEVMMLQIGEDGNIVKLGKKKNTALFRISFVLEMYKRKIDMYERFASGENLSMIRF